MKASFRCFIICILLFKFLLFITTVFRHCVYYVRQYICLTSISTGLYATLDLWNANKLHYYITVSFSLILGWFGKESRWLSWYRDKATEWKIQGLTPSTYKTFPPSINAPEPWSPLSLLLIGHRDGQSGRRLKLTSHRD
jgi:hypothetical protein